AVDGVDGYRLAIQHHPPSGGSVFEFDNACIFSRWRSELDLVFHGRRSSCSRRPSSFQRDGWSAEEDTEACFSDWLACQIAAAMAPGDKLAEKWIVIVGHGPAFIDAIVQADARAAGNLARKNFSRRGKEIIVGIFSVETNFHSMTARGDGFPCEGQAVTGGDSDLEFYEVETGNLFGYGMFDLQTRVHFQKVKIEIGINKEFNRAGIDIAASARQADSGIAHLSAQFGSDNGGRRFLDHLLMAALHGTFTFPKRDDATVGVGEDLDFHVMRTVETFFEIEAIVAETIHSLGR